MKPALPLLVCAIVAVFSFDLRAAEPTVTNVNLRALQIGGTTTLVVDGSDLKNAQLLFAFPAKQDLKPDSTDKKATFTVTLGDQVEPGFAHLRVVTESGVSSPVVIALDRMVQTPFAPSIATLPAALHGVVAGANTLECKFPGKAKQKIIVEVEAVRLGSKLRPILHLLGPDRLQLAWAWGAPNLHGDARLEATLPTDGIYAATLHDAEYAAAGGSFFRLKIGSWSFADQVYPLALMRGKGQKVELVGMENPVPLDVPASPASRVLPLSLPKGGVWSGQRPFVRLSPHPELVEQSGAKKAQDVPAGPLGISGKLLTPFEEDRYRLPVTPGKKVRLEVFAERYGSPLDVGLVIYNDKDAVVLRGDDSPGTLDPAVEYAVPDKVTTIVVGVVDAQGRGGPRGLYRLVIDPQGSSAGAETYSLFAGSQQLIVPDGGRTVLPVFAERRGYQGKIDLMPAHLPAGARFDGATIPAGADGTLLMVQRGTALDASITNWNGKGGSDEQTVFLRGHPLEKLQPWLASEIAVASSSVKASDFDIDWKSLPGDVSLIPGSKLILPVKVARTASKSPVKLTLVTSQITPLVNAKPDPNKQIRVEKAVDLAAGANDGELIVLVPADLPGPVYDVTVQAELLGGDKKTIATAFAPVKRLAVKPPLVVQLTGPNRIEVPFDAKKGASVKLQGKVERQTDLKADIAIALTGLPAAVKVEPLTLKAGTSEFTLNVVLPPTITPGEITGLKLSASAVADPKLPNVRVKSRDVELTLVVK